MYEALYKGGKALSVLIRRQGRKTSMQVNNVKLTHVGVKPEQYPSDGMSEVAFVGRSNVGKSSLINAMINRKALARTSSAPGKTRTINFYNVEDALYFVDLPGYGYAKISKTEIEKWGKMIEKYLTNREQLKCIVLLIDIRHKPGENDLLMFNWLKHYNHNMVIVATKADKLNRSQVSKHISIIKETLGTSDTDAVIPFSSETKAGKDVLWKTLEQKF